jgi:gamma-glutamyltranspeptidase/glutathione hydrolase
VSRIQGIIADTAAVATPHPEAAIAARDILQQGGNAVDASVAAILTLCVVTPSQVGLGGYGGNFIACLSPSHRHAGHRAGERGESSNRIVCVDFDSRAPLAYHDGAINNPKESLLGYKAITVPAVVAGLDTILREYGTMPWTKVSDHAVQLADTGFLLDPILKGQLDIWAAKTTPASMHALLGTDKVPPIGTRIIQKDLAKVLRQLATEGPACFYHGDIPKKIVSQIQSHAGLLTENDFAEYRPQKSDPLAIRYRNHDLYTPPPPSGGLSTFQILKVLEQFNLAHSPRRGEGWGEGVALDREVASSSLMLSQNPWTAHYFHLFTEATKLCWQDRIQLMGDPDFVKIPIAELLSDSTAARKAKQIKQGLSRNTQRITDPAPHTANICVVDKHRNVVSITATQGFHFGSQMVIDGLGLVMNHGMSRFDYIPGHPNSPAPGKRMCHNMAPTIALRDGQPLCAVGLPGGAKIVTVTAQLLINLLDFGTSPADAVSAPRIHNEGDQTIAVSSRVSDETIRELQSKGHTVVRGQTVGGPPNEIAGTANAISINPNDQKISAASGAGDDSVAGI